MLTHRHVINSDLELAEAKTQFAILFDERSVRP